MYDEPQTGITKIVIFPIFRSLKTDYVTLLLSGIVTSSPDYQGLKHRNYIKGAIPVA